MTGSKPTGRAAAARKQRSIPAAVSKPEKGGASPARRAGTVRGVPARGAMRPGANGHRLL